MNDEGQSIQPLRWLGICAGIVVVLIAFGWLIRTAVFVATAATTRGEIVEVRGETTSKGVQHYPVFSFTDTEGIEHTKRSSFDCRSATFQPGQEVSILFDRQHPQRSSIAHFNQLWESPLILLGFSLVWTGAVIFITRKRLEIPRPQDFA